MFAGSLGRAVLRYKLLMTPPGNLEVKGDHKGHRGVVSLLAFQRANMSPEVPLATLLVGHLIGRARTKLFAQRRTGLRS